MVQGIQDGAVRSFDKVNPHVEFAGSLRNYGTLSEGSMFSHLSGVNFNPEPITHDPNAPIPRYAMPNTSHNLPTFLGAEKEAIHR
jgi:hypothetical protein